MKKVFMDSAALKCESNAYLTTRIMNFLLLNNYSVVNDSNEADLILLTACGFRLQEIDSSHSAIDSYLTKYPDKKLIISGCIVDITPSLRANKKIICVGPRELHRLDELFNAKCKYEDVRVNTIDKRFFYKPISDNYFWVEIAQGCIHNCSYCTIQRAKRYVKSKPIEEIAEEVKRGLSMNKEKILLLSDDCGSYGVDRDTDFAELLNVLVGLPHVENSPSEFYIHTFHPHRLELLFPKLKKVFLSKRIACMDVDIQSGSGRIIKLMNRHYKLSRILEIIAAIRKMSPKTVLSTEIIFCFPTESRKEFFQSIRIADFFDNVTFIKYSACLGTEMLKIGNEIDEKECEFRINILKKLPKSKYGVLI